jgi:hypothetical protein
MPKPTPADLSIPPLSLATLTQPLNVGLSIETLLAELNERFPEQSPQFREDHEMLMWRGGQRDVVMWIQSKVDESQAE